MKRGTLYYHPNELRGGLPQLLPVAESDATLPLDYGWLDSAGHIVLVEHKTVQDCADSMRRRHLPDQLERAKEVTPYLYLVMTGTPASDGCGKVVGLHSTWGYVGLYNALCATLLGLQVGGPLTGTTPSETATIIQCLFGQSQRMKLGMGRPNLPQWQSTPRGTLAESYARGLGVGWEQAQVLAAAFPSWQELVASVAANGTSVLAALPRWGKITSERIATFLLCAKKEN